MQELQSSQFNIEEAKKKMSKSTRLRTDFKIAVDHIRDRVMSNIAEGRQQKLYNVTDADIAALTRVIEASFEQGFITAASQVEKTIDEVTR